MIEQYEPIQFSTYGGVPDDLSVEWYLHYILGENLSADHCIQIMKRKKREMEIIKEEFPNSRDVTYLGAPTDQIG